MKQQLTPLAVSLCLLGCISTPVLAAVNTQGDQDTTQFSQKLSHLEQEVSNLKSQLKNKKVRSSAASNTSAASAPETAPPIHVEPPTQPTSTPISTVNNLPTSGTTYLPIDLDVPGQSFVSSGPYIGIPLEFSGTNLIINSPSVNQDVALLKIRKNIHKRLEALGVHEEPDHAHVLLSGVIEGQAYILSPGTGSDSSDINLTSAGLDAYVLGPSNWLSGLISLNYDDLSGPSEGSLNNNSRALNSRVFVSQAFITIGNLLVAPIYATFGQLYVPFGTYSSNMVSTPVTQIVGRTKARAIVLGVQPQLPDTFYFATFIFKGDSYVDSSTSTVNDGGFNLGYRFKEKNMSADIGGSVIGNIADALGMQVVGNTTANFNGFGGTGITGNEQLVHRVPGYDVRGLFSFGEHINYLFEYITASTRFNMADMTMNSHGAKPQAFNTELAYSFDVFARPTSLAVGYQFTKDALALALPAQRYSVTLNTSIWRDTLQSIEFRHDVNYGASQTATGSLVPAIAVNTGKSDNAVTAQFDLYF